MDPVKNPFSPGAGYPPPELVGRDGTLQQAHIVFGRVKNKKPEKSILLTGLRGVGKTVLLNEIERLAKADGYQTIFIEAHEDKPLGPLMAPYLRSLLCELDRLAGAGDKAKRGLRVLRSFLGSLRIAYKDFPIVLDVDPEDGSADSGDPQIDLPNLMVAVAELGPGAHRTGDIADILGVKVTALGPVRAKLMKKGMVYSPAHGDMAFTVPLFDEFMRRAMPEIK